jgi:hypothetical protein
MDLTQLSLSRCKGLCDMLVGTICSNVVCGALSALPRVGDKQKHFLDFAALALGHAKQSSGRLGPKNGFQPHVGTFFVTPVARPLET